MANSLETPQGLSITRSQFAEIYPDLANHYDFFNKPIPFGTSKEYIERVYFKSKLWRLNNLYTIIDKFGNPTQFKMNYAQHKVYAASRKHSRIIILKSRQQGISTLWLISMFDDAVWCPYMNVGLMAQGTEEASTLLERTKFLWECLDPNIKQYLNLKVTADNQTKYAFSNNSVIFIRVSFRSATLQRLHISEYGKIANAYPKRAKETKTGTLQAIKGGNTAVIESTAEGRNDFQFIWDKAELAQASGQFAEKDFLPVFLPWFQDPDCVTDVLQSVDKTAERYFKELEETTSYTLSTEQKNFWIMQYRELGDDIYQEYPGTPEEAFRASRDGTYFSKQYNLHVVRKKRLVQGLYDPNLPVDVWFDLGVDDYCVMVFTQWYRGEFRIIDEYFADGMDISWYIDIAEERGYDIANYRFPHDITVRQAAGNESGGQRAKSREEIVREYFHKKDIKSTIIKHKRDASIANGIEAVRRMLKSTYVDVKCTYIISCFLNYSKKWDDKLLQWQQVPLHDEYSHGADTLRLIAQHTTEINEVHLSKYEEADRSPRPSGAAL